jgi:hypothetical protein
VQSPGFDPQHWRKKKAFQGKKLFTGTGVK